MKDFLEKLKKLRPVFSFVYKLFMTICKLLLIGDILVTCWVVLARFVPAIPAPNWGEEVILTLMVYMAVLTASLAIRRNAHIRMTVFDSKLPKKVINVLDLFSDLLVSALAIVMIIGGFAIANKIPGYYVSMPWLPKFWQYFPVALAGIAMLLFEIERIYIDLCHMVGDYSDVEIIAAETTKNIEKYATKREAK